MSCCWCGQHGFPNLDKPGCFGAVLLLARLTLRSLHPEGGPWTAVRDSQVIEAFYRYQLTPAISVTPDLQWIRGNLSGLTGSDDAFVYGLRMNMKL